MGKAAKLHENITTLNAFHPQALSGTTNITGAVIDTKGYGSVEFVLQTDAIAATSLAALLSILEDDNSGFSSGTAVADADLTSLETATAITHSDDKVTKRIGYTGSERYLRCDLTVTTNDGTDSVAAICILSNPTQAPLAAT